MPTKRRPLRGSKAYWPKKRAKSIYKKVKNWPKSDEVKPIGFAAYKIGMTHVFMTDTNPNSKTKGQMITTPVTVLECPPISVFGYRFYDKTSSLDIVAEKINKKFSRKTKIPKKNEKQEPENYNYIRLLCHANPSFKKKPEIFEIAIGGDKEKQLEFAKSVLGKEMKVGDIFKEGDFIDAIGISKGKGFQGPVKRFGVKLQARRTEQIHRHTGALGPKEPGKVRSHVPQGGQLGYQERTELNKRILKIVEAKDIIPKSGFTNGKSPKNECLLIKGNIVGPKKRFVKLRSSIRPPKVKYPVDVKGISIESQQGV